MIHLMPWSLLESNPYVSPMKMLEGAPREAKSLSVPQADSSFGLVTHGQVTASRAHCVRGPSTVSAVAA